MSQPRQDNLDEVEKRLCKGNKTKASGRLGIARITLRAKLKQYGIADEVD